MMTFLNFSLLKFYRFDFLASRNGDDVVVVAHCSNDDICDKSFS